MEGLSWKHCIKDKFWLSDEAYHELSQLSQDIPRLYKLKKASKTLNSLVLHLKVW